MATIINNPGDNSGDSAGAGLIVGVLVAILLVVLFFVYLLPTMRGNQASDNGSIDVNLKLPSGGSGTYATPSGTTSGSGTGY